MDPNANLAEQRRLIQEAFHRDGSVVAEGAEDKLLRLAELVEALDAWLSRGGFLPDAWAQKGRS